MATLQNLHQLLIMASFFLGRFANGVAISPIRISNSDSATRSIYSGIPNSIFSPSTPLISSVSSSPSTQTLPWSQSIHHSRDLSYMPMLESQLNIMKSLNVESVKIDDKFAYMTSKVKPARISSMTFKNSIFRKIRLTYFDAGDSVQVLNSLWYPDYQYDLPMLGIDLISLGLNRVLSVIDLQPLHPTAEYSDKYIAPLTNIRNRYPDLQGVLSGKFYDDTSFFSKNMLFGRFTDESKLQHVVQPAMMEYLNHYVELANTAVPNHDEASIRVVQERQKAYDVYQSIKDPAVGLFDAYFGREWSSSFVHDYLFDLSAAAASSSVHSSKSS